MLIVTTSIFKVVSFSRTVVLGTTKSTSSNTFPNSVKGGSFFQPTLSSENG
jgi:hypothetical protein